MVVSQTFNWWWKDYVLKLEMDESIKTDFVTIQRVPTCSFFEKEI